MSLFTYHFTVGLLWSHTKVNKNILLGLIRGGETGQFLYICANKALIFLNMTSDPAMTPHLTVLVFLQVFVVGNLYIMIANIDMKIFTEPSSSYLFNLIRSKVIDPRLRDIFEFYPTVQTESKHCSLA